MPFGDKPIFEISIYSHERIEQGFRKTRQAAIQDQGKASIAAESFDSPEDAIARLSVAAAKRGGFLSESLQENNMSAELR